MSKVDIPLSNLEAVIFDMDGTMIRNMAFHKKAWQEFFRRHNIELTDEQFRAKVSGKKNDQILELTFGREMDKDEADELADEKEAVYRELYREEIEEVDGLTQSIEELHEHGIKTAIATTAPRKNREFALESLNLEGMFEVVMGDEHVENGKPHPEIFLETANKLGVDPAQCVVFEDSPPGVESAKRAGMVVVALLTSHDRSELSEADYHIDDFRDINWVES